MLQFDAGVREAILSGKSESHLKQISGYKSLVTDGLDKLNQKSTSAAELIRVAVMEAQT